MVLFQNEWTKDRWLDDRPSFRPLVDKKNLVGVEIGVDSGMNAVNILTHLDIKRLYLVDPWEHYGGMSGHGVMSPDDNVEACYEHTLKLVKPFGDKVVIIRRKAEEAFVEIPDGLDFVYLDGNHRYEWVREDLRIYYPKIKDGGQIAGHDYKSGERGVCKAVDEFFNGGYNVGNWDWWRLKEYG